MPQYDFLYDLSMTFTFYDRYPQKTTTTFYLRNLQGETLEQQTAEAQQIMDEVAEELYHLTRVGIDKCVLKAGKQKIVEQTYPQYTPPEHLHFFRFAAVFSFYKCQRYEWMVDGGWKRLLSEQEKGYVQERRGQVQIKALSLRLPCVVLSDWRRKETTFFMETGAIKSGRRVTGVQVGYDSNNELFKRFMERFQNEGHFCLGEKRYFAGSPHYAIRGTFWPAPKSLLPGKARDKFPRRTVLATQPTDDTDYVYLIRMGRTNFYKIGKSNNPRSRLGSLQTGSPQKLTLVHTFRADNASAAEESLHRLFHVHRNAGEWFKLSTAQKNRLAEIDEYRDGKFRIARNLYDAPELIVE